MAVEDAPEFKLAWARVVAEAATDSAFRTDLEQDPVAVFAEHGYAATTDARKKRLSEYVHSHLEPALDAIAQRGEAVDNAAKASGSSSLVCATAGSATATQACDCSGSATRATTLPCWGGSPSSGARINAGASDVTGSQFDQPTQFASWGTAATLGSFGCFCGTAGTGGTAGTFGSAGVTAGNQLAGAATGGTSATMSGMANRGDFSTAAQFGTYGPPCACGCNCVGTNGSIATMATSRPRVMSTQLAGTATMGTSATMSGAANRGDFGTSSSGNFGTTAQFASIGCIGTAACFGSVCGTAGSAGTVGCFGCGGTHLTDLTSADITTSGATLGTAATYCGTVASSGQPSVATRDACWGTWY
jgi:hypothetical protein